MIKSTKLERMAIEARLRDALAIKGNSDIESTLNAILDLNNIEEVFLKLHKKYEELFIMECHNIYSYSGHGASYDLELERIEFIKSFNELAELFSNVAEVQQQRRNTDDVVDKESDGNACIVRSGKTQGVHVIKTPSVTNKYRSITATSPQVAQLSSQLSQRYAQLVQANNSGLQSSINNAHKKGHISVVLSTKCADCGNALTIADSHGRYCNSCFYKSLVYVCCDCKQTFTPSDINQKSCSNCQVGNLCNRCQLPFKHPHVHKYFCDSCAAIIAGVAFPKKNFIQRFFSAVFKK